MIDMTLPPLHTTRSVLLKDTITGRYVNEIWGINAFFEVRQSGRDLSCIAQKHQRDRMGGDTFRPSRKTELFSCFALDTYPGNREATQR